HPDIVDGRLAGIEGRILPCRAEETEAVSDTIARRIHCGAVVRISGDGEDLLPCLPILNPALDDLHLLEWRSNVLVHPRGNDEARPLPGSASGGCGQIPTHRHSLLIALSHEIRLAVLLVEVPATEEAHDGTCAARTIGLLALETRKNGVARVFLCPHHGDT